MWRSKCMFWYKYLICEYRFNENVLGINPCPSTAQEWLAPRLQNWNWFLKLKNIGLRTVIYWLKNRTFFSSIRSISHLRILNLTAVKTVSLTGIALTFTKCLFVERVACQKFWINLPFTFRTVFTDQQQRE